MDIEIQQTDDATIYNLVGRLDAVNAPQVQQKIVDSLDLDKNCVIDFSKLDYVSSAGLRVLLIVSKKLRAGSNKGVDIINAQPQIEELLKMSGFDNFLNIR